MDGAFAWVGAIFEWFGMWIPKFTIIDVTHAGVKYRRGSEVIPLAAGIHWWWPARSTIHVYPIARQANDLRAQTIVTKDHKTVTLGGMIVYEVSDIEKILAYTFDPDDTIRDVALTAVHDVCIQYNLEELMEASRKGTLDTALRREAKKALEPYGIQVLKVSLTDLAPCRVFRIVGGNGGLEALQGILKGS